MTTFTPGNYRRGGTVCQHGWILNLKGHNYITVRCAFCTATLSFHTIDFLNPSHRKI